MLVRQLAEQRIEADEQFAHHRRQSHFFEFAGFPQALVKVLQHRIVTAGAEGRHVQSTAGAFSSALDEAFVFLEATIVIERSQAHQTRNAIAPQGTQLWQSD